MSKAGRKRKPDVPRYPNGGTMHVTPTGRRQSKAEVASPAAIKRMVERAKRNAEDPLLGTVPGWLHLHGAITHKQLAAAEAYGRLRGRFDRMMGIPSRSAKSPAYGLRNGPSEAILDDRVMREIRSAHTDMLRSVGGLYTLLERVCVDDRHPVVTELPVFCAALDMLAKHFQMEA
jgi:hypothetical protein